MLERIPSGVVLVGAEGGVVFVNRLAKQILDQNDGLSLAKGRLMAASGSDARKLDHLVRGAARTGAAQGIEPGGALPISRPSMRRPLGVLVAPLRTKDVYLLRKGACAVVFLSDPETRVDSPTDLLQRTYGLTPAETDFCALFVQGKSVREIALELEITVATARLYLKRVLAKTDTHRQAALMRLLLTGLPAVLPDR